MLGKVHQKLECRPVYDTNYMKLKMTAIHKASQPVRQVQQLDRVVQSYKPVSDHKNNVSRNCLTKLLIFMVTIRFIYSGGLYLMNGDGCDY